MDSRKSAKPAGRSAANEFPRNPLYGVAMLKIAMELKKPRGQTLDDILSQVLGRMKISEVEFRKYLSENGGLLRAIAQRKH